MLDARHELKKRRAPRVEVKHNIKSMADMASASALTNLESLAQMKGCLPLLHPLCMSSDTNLELTIKELLQRNSVYQ
jgi:hypothetical protein